MSYLYSRYLKKDTQTPGSCRLPIWDPENLKEAQIMPEEEMPLGPGPVEDMPMPGWRMDRWEPDGPCPMPTDETEPMPEPVPGQREQNEPERMPEEEMPEEDGMQMPGNEREMPRVPIPGWEPEDMPEDDFSEGTGWDQGYFRPMYPPCIRRMKDYVEEECDRLDGPGSLIYDEYPDRERLRLARDRAFNRMRQDSVPEAIQQESFARDVAETLLYQEILERRNSGRRIKK